MNKKSQKVLSICCTLLLSFFLVSCVDNDKKQISVDKMEGIKLLKGAVLSNDNGAYSNFNIDGNECSKVASNEQIWAYDYKSDNYFGMEGDKYFAFYNGSKVTLDSITSSDEGFKISPGGKYLLFFRNDDGYKTIIINLENGSEVEFKSDVLISGKLIDWIGEDTIAYYGVNPDKNENGIFTYDLKDSSESLKYKIDYGDALFLKGYENGVIFLQEQIDKGRFLKKIDINTNKVEILSGNVLMVYDLVRDDDKIYILGKIKDNNISLYQIAGTTTKRMIYDYPKQIKIEKGLKLDKDGNVLFIGLRDDSSKEDIFKCTPRGDISIIKNTLSEYAFVN